MSKLILEVKNKRKIPFLKELLKHMEFVEVIENDPAKPNQARKQLLKEIDEAVDFVNNHKKGATKTKSLNQLLSEL